MIYIVSSCLLGEKCRYDGGSSYNQKLENFLKGKVVLSLCPEVLGGMTIPREPCEIVNIKDYSMGSEPKVETKDGKDCSQYFLKGTENAIEIIEKLLDKEDLDEEGVVAILKSKSPSCGTKGIYDGSFSRKLIDNMGIFAKELHKRKIKILSEDDFL